MWMPCQVMAVLCRCSAKESIAFTVQAEMNRQPAFFGIRGFTASFSQVTMWLWVHFNSRMDTSSGRVLYTVRSFMFTGCCVAH